MTCGEGLIVCRADDPEIAVLDQRIQSLAPAEVIEVAADDGALAALHQLRDFLKLLLANGSMQRVVPDEE